MADRKINRTVNIDEELYGPGEEDAMLEHLQSKDDEVDGHDHLNELHRMERDGFIEGFVDVDEDELLAHRHGTPDERANRQAQVEERKTAAKAKRRKPKTEQDEE